MAYHNKVGERGEKIAADYFTKNGFHIRVRNLHLGKAEVDLILEKDGRLHIVEVKTVSSLDHHDPHEAVNRRKEKLLIEAAETYLEQEDLDMEVQFDVLGIVLFDPPKITYFPEAFTAMD